MDVWHLDGNKMVSRGMGAACHVDEDGLGFNASGVLLFLPCCCFCELEPAGGVADAASRDFCPPLVVFE